MKQQHTSNAARRALAEELHSPLPAALDEFLNQGLSAAPEILIPSTFASRVTALAAAQPRQRRAYGKGWGPRLLAGSAALLTLSLFVLAPHAAPSLRDFRFDAEMLLFAELGGLLLFSGQVFFQE